MSTRDGLRGQQSHRLDIFRDLYGRLAVAVAPEKPHTFGYFFCIARFDVAVLGFLRAQS